MIIGVTAPLKDAETTAEDRMWIDVEDADGNRLGAGPITSAEGWQQRRRLSRAGEFVFQMPAADPQRALLQFRRVVRCWEYDPFGGLVEIGAGVVERVRTVVTPNAPTMIDVSGGSLARQLADRVVGELDLMVETESTPASINRQPAGTELSAAYDGNPATYNVVDLAWPGYPADFLYVEYTSTFHAVSLVLGAAVNAVVGTLKGQFYNEESGDWEYVTITTDGTDVGGAPFAQSGKIDFEMPKGWGTGPVAGHYTARWYVEANIDVVDVVEVTIHHWEGTATALAEVMALAPASWSLDVVQGYAATVEPVYLKLADTTVLEALVRLVEQTGENWIEGAGRRIVWLGTDIRDSGLRAVANVDPIAVAAADEILVIADLRAGPDADASDLCSRVVPRGGGTGTMRPTLAQTTRSAPAGYTLDAANNWLRKDDTETTYGRIEHPLPCTDIVARDTSESQQIEAANALFDRSKEYLDRHSVPLQTYDGQVVKIARPLLPGYRVRLIYDEWVDAYHAVGIDEDLWVMETVEELGPDRLRVVGLTLSTVDRWIQADDVALAQNMQRVQTLAGTTPPQVGYNSLARGIPFYVTVEDGSITSISRQIPIADGVYSLGVGSLGVDGHMTIRNGVVIAILEPS